MLSSLSSSSDLSFTVEQLDVQDPYEDIIKARNNIIAALKNPQQNEFDVESMDNLKLEDDTDFSPQISHERLFHKCSADSYNERETFGFKITPAQYNGICKQAYFDTYGETHEQFLTRSKAFSFDDNITSTVQLQAPMSSHTGNKKFQGEHKIDPGIDFGYSELKASCGFSPRSASLRSANLIGTESSSKSLNEFVRAENSIISRFKQNKKVGRNTETSLLPSLKQKNCIKTDESFGKQQWFRIPAQLIENKGVKCANKAISMPFMDDCFKKKSREPYSKTKNMVRPGSHMDLSYSNHNKHSSFDNDRKFKLPNTDNEECSTTPNAKVSRNKTIKERFMWSLGKRGKQTKKTSRNGRKASKSMRPCPQLRKHNFAFTNQSHYISHQLSIKKKIWSGATKN